MDVFLKQGIKIPNAVLVEGISVIENKEEVLDFLNLYGSICKAEEISAPNSEFDETFVVEFSSSATITALEQLLPYTLVSSDQITTFCISDLSTVCTAYEAKHKTKSYMSELKDLAKLTGKDYGEVLKAMMTQIGLSIAALQPALQVEESPPDVKTTIVSSEPSATSVPSPFTTAPVSDISAGHPGSRPHAISFQTTQQPSKQPSISNLDIHPPEVQRYVVEHILKSNEGATHHQRLGVFSGRLPRPPPEADFETWRSGVDMLLRDPSMSDLQRSRKIVDSLLPPAADLVKHMSSGTLPIVYLDMLDSAYGIVQDGDELYAKFMDTFQNAGERPSSYLQRLQVSLVVAVKRGGVLATDIDRHLLSQFCRGCWDDNLIAELQLKQKKASPPTFAELLLLLRTEEDREAAKALRMKQHLGSSRQKVVTHAQYAVYDSEERRTVANLTNVTQQLAKQLADVQRQLDVLIVNQMHQDTSHFKAQSINKQTGKSETSPAPALRRVAPSQFKPGFCFRCGEDGHIRPQCKNEPNSNLVARKKKQFAQKQQLTSRHHSLN